MTFIIEDGSGKKGATSYASVADFRGYHLDRAVDTSGIDDTAAQALLIAATDYIDTRWGSRFLGLRQHAALLSRSVLTLTAIPSDGETVTFGSQTYTFKTTPVATTDVEIGVDVFESLLNLTVAVSASSNEDFLGALFTDPDVAELTMHAVRDGIVTTMTLANGTFDVAASVGASGKRQPLEFPRAFLTDRSGLPVLGVPGKLEAATIEYAIRANTATLAPDPTVPASGNQITATKVVIGPIETETKFSAQGIPQITRPFPTADRLLEEYVIQPGVTRA